MALAFSTIQDALDHSTMLWEVERSQATTTAQVQAADQHRDDRHLAARVAFLGKTVSIPPGVMPLRSGAQNWLTTKFDTKA